VSGWTSSITSSLRFIVLRPTSLEEFASASALAIPTGNSASEKVTKRPKESRAYTLSRTASRGRRRIKRTIMNRSVHWTHLLFYSVRNRSVLDC
jgi:hypothetical protein